MSNSLHNKIHLGRQSALGTRIVQRALLVGAILGVAVAWVALSGFK